MKPYRASKPKFFGRVIVEDGYGLSAEWISAGKNKKRNFMYLQDHGEIKGHKISAKEAAVAWLINEGAQEIDIIETIRPSHCHYSAIARLKMMEKVI
jgi:hypothetical protein